MAVMKIGRGSREERQRLGAAGFRHEPIESRIDEATRLLMAREPSPEARRAVLAAIARLQTSAAAAGFELQRRSWRLTAISMSMAMVLLGFVAFRLFVPPATGAQAYAGEALLIQLSGSSFAFWINTTFVYPGFLFIHTLGLALVVGIGLAVDLRLLGVAARVPLAALRALIPAIWVGFWMSVVSGVVLFTADAPGKGENALFSIKLVLVASGVIVTGLIERHLFRADGDMSPSRSRTLAIISLVLWIAAIVAGRLVGYAVDGAFV